MIENSERPRNEAAALHGDEPLKPRYSTLQEALESAAQNGACLLFAKGLEQPKTVTWQQLLDQAQRIAQHLLHCGLERSGRVMIMLPTGDSWVASFFGVLLAGGVPVPLGPTFSFGGIDRYMHTVRHICIDAGAQFFLGNEAVEKRVPMLREDNPHWKYFFRPESLSTPLPTSRPLPSPSAKDLAILQYTSGTTSLPKGVMIQQQAMVMNAQMIGDRAGMTPQDRGVSWLPLFHDMGLVGALMTSLVWQYPLLLMPSETFLLHPWRWLQHLSQQRATLTVAPNFAYQTAVDRLSEEHLAGLDLSALRCVFNGSEAVRANTLRAFEQKFAPCGFQPKAFLPVYGMAENTLEVTQPPKGTTWSSLSVDRGNLEQPGEVIRPSSDAHSAELVSVGTPLAGVHVEVRDAAGKPLPERSLGEIHLASPSVMCGYWRAESKTEAVLQNGWLATGDLGFLAEGELYIAGRAKEMIIKRGRNYYPEDIESVALEAAGRGVRAAAAFGRQNEVSGTEDVVLVLETPSLDGKKRDSLDKAINGALIAALGIRADELVFVPLRTILRTTSGKVQRAPLRDRYAARPSELARREPETGE